MVAEEGPGEEPEEEPGYLEGEVEALQQLMLVDRTMAPVQDSRQRQYQPVSRRQRLREPMLRAWRTILPTLGKCCFATSSRTPLPPPLLQECKCKQDYRKEVEVNVALVAVVAVVAIVGVIVIVVLVARMLLEVALVVAVVMVACVCLSSRFLALAVTV